MTFEEWQSLFSESYKAFNETSPAFKELISEVVSFAEARATSLYLVGGSVRDFLTGHEVKDVDIAVEGDAFVFAEDFAAYFGADFKLYEKFRTASVMNRAVSIDFASARAEVYPEPGALPQVAFSDIKTDLKRRDFTVNAIAARLSSSGAELFDPNDGLSDIRAKKIRILHKDSFKDDPTRLFRALRFAERLGYSLSEKTKILFDEAVENNFCSTLSNSRICAELEKIFLEDSLPTLLPKVCKSALLRVLSFSFEAFPPSSFALEEAQKICSKSSKEHSEELLLYFSWGILLGNLPDSEISQLLEMLPLKRTVRKKLEAYFTVRKDLETDLEELSEDNRAKLYGLLHKHSEETLLLLVLNSKRSIVRKNTLFFLKYLGTMTPKIKPDELIQIGIPEGVHIRLALEFIAYKKADNPEMSKDEEIILAKNYLESLK